MVCNKRGQLTMFIIVAVVIVVAVVGYFVFANRAGDSYFRDGEVKEGVDNIKDFLVECVEYSSDDALVGVQYQGGYYEAPSVIEDYGDGYFSPYYTYEGVNHVPSLKVIESEMGKAVDDIVGGCVDSADFTGYDLRYTAIKTNVEIGDDEVEFVVDMPIVLEREGHTMVIEMKNYPVVIPSKMMGMYNVAQYLVEDLKDDSMYCVNCLAELAEANDVFVDVIGVDETTSGVILTDNSLGDEDLSYYTFLNKFSVGSVPRGPQFDEFD